MLGEFEEKMRLAEERYGPILEQLRQAKARVRQQPHREQERVKEAAREDR